MLNFFNRKVNLETTLKILNKQARLNFQTYSTLIKSIEDRLTLIESELREMRDLYQQVFQKAQVITK